MLTPILLLPQLVAIADRAGEVLLKHYREGVVARQKADASPITAADEAGEALIGRAANADAQHPDRGRGGGGRGRIPEVGDQPFWLVDPLDGTKEFISKNGEFTVNIGLIDRRRPVLGVVLAPARGLAWWGAAGQGAVRREDGQVRAIKVRSRPGTGAVAVASRSHRDAETDAWLAERASPTRCRPAVRSSSVWSPKARPMSTRASGRPWSGIPRRAMPFCAPQAAPS